MVTHGRAMSENWKTPSEVSTFSGMKETFLKEITSEFGHKPFAFDDKKFLLIGVPFYNNEVENQFIASLESVLNQARQPK